MSRYMDPTTDFGFKKLFGDEANKDLTISFLNDLLELESPLLDLSFSNPEQLPEASEQRTGIYDLLCRDVEGNQYLVEMQKSKLAFVKDRMVYYSTFPIAAQAPKGSKRIYDPEPSFESLRIRDAANIVYGEEIAEVDTSKWNYALKGVYCIAILDYSLKGSTTAVTYSSIRNNRPPHEPFYDKLTFVTVELPLFDPRKSEYSLDRHRNKWLYFLKHLRDFDRIPDVFKNDKIFQKAFWIAELASFTSEERRRYQLNIKRLRDTYAVLTTSYDDGKVAGKIEGRTEGKAEGKVEGRIEHGQNTLHLLFSQKLGPIPEEIAKAINCLNDLERIDAILARFMEINDWETLQKYLTAFH